MSSNDCIASFVQASDVMYKKYPRDYVIISASVAQLDAITNIFGKAEINKMLEEIDACLKNLLVSSGVYARISNNLFAIFTPFSDHSSFRKTFDFIMTEITRWLISAQADYNVQFNWGVFSLSMTEPDVTERMFRSADCARESIRAVAESTYAFYSDKMSILTEHADQLLADLPAALKKGEFSLSLQPKVALDTQSVVGVETYVKWNHPVLGNIPAGQFISLAERTGLIIDLDYYVVDMICRKLREWINKGMDLYPFAVNFSVNHVYKRDFVKTVMEVLDKYKIPPQLIEVEISETAFAGNIEPLTAIFKQFREQGFRLSIDNLGKGYSSLTILRNVEFDVVKLDRSFFLEDLDNDRILTYVSNLVKLLKGLGLEIVGECVETELQAEYLSSLGCDYAQGYLYAKPLSLEEFESTYCSVPGNLFSLHSTNSVD